LQNLHNKLHPDHLAGAQKYLDYLPEFAAAPNASLVPKGNCLIK
jgi:hypothetical protein